MLSELVVMRRSQDFTPRAAIRMPIVFVNITVVSREAPHIINRSMPPTVIFELHGAR